MRILLCFFIFTGLQISGYAQQDGRLLLRAGFPMYAFSGVMANDAEVVISFYLKKVTETIGFSYHSSIYQDSASLRRDMKKGVLDFVVVTPPELMDPEINQRFEPFLVPQRGNGMDRLMLLVHRDSGWTSAADLKDKNLLLFSGSDSGVELKWLNRELSRAGQLQAGQHFKSMVHSQGAAKSVLPVFFKKADACVVSDVVFDVVCKLNPQVRQRLVPLARSEPLLSTVIAIRRDFSKEGRARLEKQALTLGDTPEGRQVLLMTKIDRVNKYHPDFLKSTMALLETGTGSLDSGNTEPSTTPAETP